MKIYDYGIGACIEISSAQYDFMGVVMRHGGRMEEVFKDYPISDDQIKEWRADKPFWDVLESYLTVLHKSKGLTAEYVKSYLLTTLEGKNEPTKAQTTAINAAVRALGMGNTIRQGFQGAISVTPDNTTIVFNDGLSNEPPQITDGK